MKYLLTTVCTLLTMATFLPIQSEAVLAQRGGKNRGKTATQGQNGPMRNQTSGKSLSDNRGRGNGSSGNKGGATSAEIQTLLADMRQEEKLARDVYKTLHAKWNEPVFTRIAASEQQHMNTLKNLLGRYGIADPIVNDQVGVFPSARFTQLYQQLVDEGSVSQVSALQVGMKIEEMDIADLRKTAKAVEERDILKVLQRLERASHNHLRAFANRLQTLGGNYQPQFLSAADFQNILQGSNAGNGRSQGGNGSQGGRASGSGQFGGQGNGSASGGQGGQNQGGQSRGRGRGRRNGGR